MGLLVIDYDDTGIICGLSIGKTSELSDAVPAIRKEEIAKPTAAPKAESPLRSAVALKPDQPLRSAAAENQEQLRQLYFVAEQYMGKPLSSKDIQKINYFFDTLHFSTDLIEYLIEYCVENKSMHYIESVALAWSDENIKSVTEAKTSSATYNKNCYTVLNAFGIKGRSPAAVELSYIKKWTEEYGLTLEIIVEACNRTIANTHQPDFKYTDSILKNWIATNRFNNFEGRSYDISSLEQQLLNTP